MRLFVFISFLFIDRASNPIKGILFFPCFLKLLTVESDVFKFFDVFPLSSYFFAKKIWSNTVNDSLYVGLFKTATESLPNRFGPIV